MPDQPPKPLLAPLRAPHGAGRAKRGDKIADAAPIEPLADTIARAEAIIAANRVKARAIAVQLPLALDLVEQPRIKPWLVRPHGKARERELAVLTMTLKRRKVREIAAALDND